MNFGDFTANAALLWLTAAVVLGVAELIIPGVFVVFLALAAVAVGVTMLAAPGLPVAIQLIAFAVWSGISVLIGRRWYREYPVESADPLLNDRAARLIGEVVTVVVPIEHGHGRVRVGDGEWLARGPDAAAGTRVRVVACSSAVLTVEAVEGA